MAPEVTSRTWWPAARTAAASAQNFPMAVSSIVPSAAVMDEVPILATTITSPSLPRRTRRSPLRSTPAAPGPTERQRRAAETGQP